MKTYGPKIILCLTILIGTYASGMTKTQFEAKKMEVKQLIINNPSQQEQYILTLLAELGRNIPRVIGADTQWRIAQRKAVHDLASELDDRITQATIQHTYTNRIQSINRLITLTTAPAKLDEYLYILNDIYVDPAYIRFIPQNQRDADFKQLTQLIKAKLHTLFSPEVTQEETEVVQWMHYSYEHDIRIVEGYVSIATTQAQLDYCKNEIKKIHDNPDYARFIPQEKRNFDLTRIIRTIDAKIGVLPSAPSPTPAIPSVKPSPKPAPAPVPSYLPSSEVSPEALQARYSPEAIQARYAKEIANLEHAMNIADPKEIPGLLAELDRIMRDEHYKKVIDPAQRNGDYRRLTDLGQDRLQESVAVPPASTPAKSASLIKEVLSDFEQVQKSSIEDAIANAYTYAELEDAHQAALKEFGGTRPQTLKALIQKIEERKAYLQKEGILPKPKRKRAA